MKWLLILGTFGIALNCHIFCMIGGMAELSNKILNFI